MIQLLASKSPLPVFFHLQSWYLGTPEGLVWTYSDVKVQQSMDPSAPGDASVSPYSEMACTGYTRFQIRGHVEGSWYRL